jgi:hypothetical protein
MRTTLDIADDVLFAAKELARRETKPLGQIISELARRAFALPSEGMAGDQPPKPGARKVSDRLAKYGIHPLSPRGGIVTNELIARLRDEESI